MKDRTAVADWAGYLAEAITRRNLPHWCYYFRVV
jgi:hypothetical protein